MDETMPFEFRQSVGIHNPLEKDVRKKVVHNNR
jgi:hypothetical protein